MLTLCEEAPQPPAQIMELVILEPQYCWHCVTVTRGRATCCRRAGDTLPMCQERVVRPQTPCPHPSSPTQIFGPSSHLCH